jgi:hypothetical protein
LDIVSPTGQPNVYFEFMDPILNGLGPLPAVLTMQSWCCGPRHDQSPVVSVNMVFSYAGLNPIIVHGNSYSAGAVLAYLNMSIPLVGGDRFEGMSIGSDVADFGPLNTAHSDGYMNFLPQPDLEYPSVHLKHYPYVSAFTAQIAGGFGSSVVPEPAVWLSMLLGFGLAGIALRRRRLEAGRA